MQKKSLMTEWQSLNFLPTSSNVWISSPNNPYLKVNISFSLGFKSPKIAFISSLAISPKTLFSKSFHFASFETTSSTFEATSSDLLSNLFKIAVN